MEMLLYQLVEIKFVRIIDFFICNPQDCKITPSYLYLYPFLIFQVDSLCTDYIVQKHQKNSTFQIFIRLPFYLFAIFHRGHAIVESSRKRKRNTNMTMVFCGGTEICVPTEWYSTIPNRPYQTTAQSYRLFLFSHEPSGSETPLGVELHTDVLRKREFFLKVCPNLW